jgi:hypothetical protein
VFLGIETVVASAADSVASIVMAVSAIAVGGALVLAARAAGRGRRAVRSPIIVWQLMQLSVAYLTWSTAWLALGIVLALAAVVAAGAALWPGILEEDAPSM